MKIKVLKETRAASDLNGLSVKTYKKDEVYDIFDDLAVVFIKNKWGEEALEKKSFKVELSNKAIENSPENKAAPKVQAKRTIAPKGLFGKKSASKKGK